MQADCSDEKLVREYLLGSLTAEDQDRIERRFLSDSGFEDLVAVIEDELIEEYLEDALPKSERQAIEKHFLLPPERQRKLQFARALRSRLQGQAAPVVETGRSGWQWLPFRLPPMVFPGASAALVAVVVMAGSALYIGRLNQNLKKEIEANKTAQSELQAELTTERERIKLLEAKREFLNVDLVAGVVRGDSRQPSVTLNPLVHGIEFNIPVTYELPPYNIEVRTEAGGKVMSMSDLQLDRKNGGKQLVFYIPAHYLIPGQYTVTLTVGHGTVEKYNFTVSR